MGLWCTPVFKPAKYRLKPSFVTYITIFFAGEIMSKKGWYWIPIFFFIQLARKKNDDIPIIFPAHSHPNLMTRRKAQAAQTYPLVSSNAGNPQEVKQVNATRSKTPWDALCRSVIFRSLAVHFSIAKFSNSPSGRVCIVLSRNLKYICIYIHGC